MTGQRDDEAVEAQVLTWAHTWDNVRAVVLNGSRADPKRTIDALSDFDLAVYVRSTDPILADDSWLRSFGRVMVRWPRKPETTFSSMWVTQLVLFDDGARIDFQFSSQGAMAAGHLDPWYRILVDKDGLGEVLPPPPLAQRTIEPPTAEAFASRLNAFWWDIVYVAKGLSRDELPYAKFMLEGTIRFEKVAPLLCWYVGLHHGWEVDVGIHGRWLQRYLDPPTWERYLQTFAGADCEENWQAMFATVALVRATGKEVAAALGFVYPEHVDAEVTQYLRKIHDSEQQTATTQRPGGP